MKCAAHCCAIDDNFNRTVATQQLDRYRRKGASPSTRALIDAIRRTGIEGSTILDIGAGVGAISAELLVAGASHATVVEASQAYLDIAREHLTEKGLANRSDFVHGDAVTLLDDMGSVDVVVLDKVLCCYPDMQTLVEQSARRAARLYGVIYPRDAWWVRLAIGLENLVRRVRKLDFRVHVFDNEAVDGTIRAAGFTRVQEERALVWIRAVYSRTGVTA